MFKGDLQKHFVFDDYLSSDAIDIVKAVLGDGNFCGLCDAT